MLKTKELETKTEAELLSLVRELTAKQRRLKFDLKMGKLQNTAQLSLTRKELARVKTILRLKYGRKI